MGGGDGAGQREAKALVPAAGRVAREQQRAGLAQRLGGKAGPGIPHREGDCPARFGLGGGQGDLPAGRGEAGGIVKHIVQRPAEPLSLRGEGAAGRQPVFESKGQFARGGQRPAYGGALGQKRGGIDRGEGFRIRVGRGSRGAQRGKVIPGAVGRPQDGRGVPGGFGGQLALGQQLGVAGNHGQRGFQVVGQCGDLLGAGRLGRPLGFQACGQLFAQRLHRLQSGVQLPDLPAREGRAGQRAGADLVGRGLQPLALPPQPAGRAAGGQHHKPQFGRGQHQQPQQLEIGQPAQPGQGIGHREIVGQQADAAIRQRDPARKGLGERIGRALAMPAAQRGLQRPPAYIGGNDLVRIRRGKQHIAAQRVKRGFGKGLCRVGRQRFCGRQRRAFAAVGRQHQPAVDEDRNPQPPQNGGQDAKRRRQQQIPRQQPRQRGRAVKRPCHGRSSFHL